MKTLYIETSTEKSCLAIGDEKILCSIPLSGGPELSKNLALEVSKLLKYNDFKPERILIGKGPGSHTGIRVGAALGKALAFGWQIPAIEFCSLHTFFPPEETQKCAVLVDARLGGIYCLTKEMREPRLFSPEELIEELRAIPLLLSPDPRRIEKRLGQACLEAFPCFEKTGLI